MAIAFFDELTHSATDAAVRQRVAAVAQLAEHYELLRAIGEAERTVRDFPNSALALIALADLRFLTKDYHGAEREYRLVLRRRPTDRVAWFMVARCQTETWRNAEAVDSLLKCLQCTHTPAKETIPAATWAELNTGNVVHDYRSLLESTVNEDVLTRRHLADALIKCDRFEDAVECLTPALALIPRDWSMRYQCGVATYLDGRFQEAAKYFAEVLTFVPTDFRAAFFAASAHLEDGDESRALELCRLGLLPHLAHVDHFTGEAPAAQDGESIVALPWNLRAYLFSGLFHPLLLALLDAPLTKHRLQFCGESNGKFIPDAQMLATLNGFRSTLAHLRTTCTKASAGHIFAYLESRHLLSQMFTPRDTRLAIPHTAPYSLLDHPWLLHIETPTTIFAPFVTYGMTQGLDLEASPYYDIVRAYLESPSCVGVFSHLQSTCNVLPRLFKSNTIARKVHYMPLGAPQGDRPGDDEFERKCAAALAGATPRRILFTSSFNQSDWSFYSRGGLYVLNAFVELAEEFPDIELVLRSTLPVNIDPKWVETIVRHPRIQVLHKKLSNEAIADLYTGSEIMAFPSYTLHCQSLFRAMYSGAICVISDAPDYDEFIVDRETAVVAHRAAGLAYERDAIGMTREFYPEMRMFDADFAKDVTAAFRYVLEDRSRADRMRREARRTIVDRYPRTQMFEAFNEILECADGRIAASARR